MEFLTPHPVKGQHCLCRYFRAPEAYLVSGSASRLLATISPAFSHASTPAAMREVNSAISSFMTGFMCLPFFLRQEGNCAQLAG